VSEKSLADKWDRQHRDSDPDQAKPATVLSDHAYLLPSTGTALDVACGTGGNATLMASHGLHTDAWDISQVAVDQLNSFAQRRKLTLEAACRDIIAQPPAPDSYDVIVCSRFLARELCPHLVRALRPGGLLFYQTFTKTHLRSTGPSNPAYRLDDGELLSLFSDVQLIFYREERDIGTIAFGVRDEATLIGRRK